MNQRISLIVFLGCGKVDKEYHFNTFTIKKKFKKVNRRHFDTPHYIKKETLKEEDRVKDVIFVVKDRDWEFNCKNGEFEECITKVLEQERKKVYNTQVVYEWIANDFYKQTKRKAKRSLI